MSCFYCKGDLIPSTTVYTAQIDNAIIVITHYQRLLDFIVPDFVHVLYEGRIVKTGPKELALELEERGYDWIKKELGE